MKVLHHKFMVATKTKPQVMSQEQRLCLEYFKHRLTIHRIFSLPAHMICPEEESAELAVVPAAAGNGLVSELIELAAAGFGKGEMVEYRADVHGEHMFFRVLRSSMQGIYTQQYDGRASSTVQVLLLGERLPGASQFAAASGDISMTVLKVDIVHMMNKHGVKHIADNLFGWTDAVEAVLSLAEDPLAGAMQVHQAQVNYPANLQSRSFVDEAHQAMFVDVFTV